MADPVDPIDPIPMPTPEPGTSTTSSATNSTTSSSTGLPSNVAAALACFPLIGGIIFFVIEKRDAFVRFYAMQSIILGGAWFLFAMVSSVVHMIVLALPAIGVVLSIMWGLLAALIYLAFLVVFIITIVKAFMGERWEIPYIGPIAQKQSSATPVI
jgi:uncharacterized membrane protein